MKILIALPLMNTRTPSPQSGAPSERRSGSFSPWWRAAALCALVKVPLCAGPLDTLQQLFDCIAKHDAAKARTLFLPGVQLISIASGSEYKSIAVEQWLTRMGEGKGEWRETIRNPTVLKHEGLAAVWGPYQFHLNGKLSHCGVDWVNLVKTAEGWKISSLAWTRETTGCEIH